MSIVLATAAGLLVYVIAYKFIYRYQTRDLKEATGSLFRVVGTLVSLMLSLAFTEVIVDLTGTENAI